LANNDDDNDDDDMRGISLLNRMGGIRCRANEWLTLTRKFNFKGTSSINYFARIERPVLTLQLCR